jgi:hypothetical protein
MARLPGRPRRVTLLAGRTSLALPNTGCSCSRLVSVFSAYLPCEQDRGKITFLELIRFDNSKKLRSNLEKNWRNKDLLKIDLCQVFDSIGAP